MIVFPNEGEKKAGAYVIAAEKKKRGVSILRSQKRKPALCLTPPRRGRAFPCGGKRGGALFIHVTGEKTRIFCDAVIGGKKASEKALPKK